MQDPRDRVDMGKLRLEDSGGERGDWNRPRLWDLFYYLSHYGGRNRRKGLASVFDYCLVCHQISEKSTALWINTVLGVSTLLALWSLAIIFRQAKLHLGEQNMGAKFALFQVTMSWERKDGS